MTTKFKTVKPPKDGLWRVGWKGKHLDFYRPEPQFPPPPHEPRHRFDDLLGHTATGYFATTPQGAFTETALNYRPDPDIAAMLPGDDSIGPGNLPAKFRHDRLLVHANLTPTPIRPDLAFVDLEDAGNLATLTNDLSEILAVMKIDRLTLGHVHGDSRVLTSMIASRLMHDQNDNGVHPYSGARYFSKYGANHECWVAFEGTEPILIEALAIQANNPDLRAVAKELGLNFH